MRVQNTCATAIDIIIIDIYQFESYTPILNGLSDHDAKLLISTDYSHMPIQNVKPSEKLIP
jgi:hypothetical protein